MSISLIATPQNAILYKHLQNISTATKINLTGALATVGMETARHAKALIRDKNKNGRWYVYKGRRYQASAPGEAPANRSGELQRSVGYQVYGWHRVEVGARVFYGKYLEEGTKKMEARPFLIRSLKEKQRDNYSSVEQAMNQAVFTKSTYRSFLGGR